MDFLGFWICYSPLNFTQNDTKTSFIPFFSGYMTFFAFDYRTINEPFKCTKFQPDWSTNSRFMADFAKCAKRSRRRKKRRKKTQTLAALISEMAGAIFFKLGMWIPLPSRHFCSNFGFNRIRNHGATKV